MKSLRTYPRAFSPVLFSLSWRACCGCQYGPRGHNGLRWKSSRRCDKVRSIGHSRVSALEARPDLSLHRAREQGAVHRATIHANGPWAMAKFQRERWPSPASLRGADPSRRCGNGHMARPDTLSARAALPTEPRPRPIPHGISGNQLDAPKAGRQSPSGANAGLDQHRASCRSGPSVKPMAALSSLMRL
jgi:hypothetical protein